MENEKSLLDEEDATELPERDALSVIDPTRMGAGLVPSISPADAGPELTTDQGLPEGSAPA
jgi:hypothetical protein